MIEGRRFDFEDRSVLLLEVRPFVGGWIWNLLKGIVQELGELVMVQLQVRMLVRVRTEVLI